jgi:hypothetical protein
MRRGFLAMTAAGLFGLTTHAAGQSKAPLGDVLDVHADDAGCVTEPALRSRVQRWLKPQAIAPDVHVEVDAAATPPRFAVQRGGQDVAARSFDVLPEACSDRLDAIAIAVALAIEHATQPESAEATAPGTSTTAPDASAPSQEAEPEAPPATPAPDEAKRAAAREEQEKEKDQEPEQTEADRRAASARGVAPRLYAGGGVIYKVLPELVPAFALGTDLPLDSFRLGREWPLTWLRLDAALLATLQTSTDIGPGQLKANLLGGRVLTCSEVALAAFAIATCSGVGGGAALASGSNYIVRKHAAAVWLAGIARVSVRFPASSVVSLRLAADGLVNIVRPKLVVEGDNGETRTAGVVGIAGSLELLLALP